MRAEMVVTKVRLPSRRRAGRPAFAAGERQHQAANPAMRETQLLITYRGSPIVADLCSDANPEAPAPGDRLPDVRGLAQRYVGHARRLHDFVGSGRHTLIGHVDAAGQQYDAFFDGCRALAASLPGAASAVLVPKTPVFRGETPVEGK